MATNGLAMNLTPDEAAILAESPMVRSISEEVTYRLDTYAGPRWLGADVVWNGDAGLPAAGGEGSAQPLNVLSHHSLKAVSLLER